MLNWWKRPNTKSGLPRWCHWLVRVLDKLQDASEWPGQAIGWRLLDWQVRLKDVWCECMQCQQRKLEHGYKQWPKQGYAPAKIEGEPKPTE